MNTKEFQLQFLPFYLFVVLLLQIPFTVQNIFLCCLPFVLIIVSIHFRKRNVSLAGMFLFYLVSFSLVQFSSMTQDLLLFVLELVILVFPSVILLGIILQLDNTQVVFGSERKTPLLVAGSTVFMIIGVFSLALFVFPDQLLNSAESLQRQLILLVALTVVCCAPLLVSKK